MVDANVWVSALDPLDPLQAESRTFLMVLAKRRSKVVVPALARLEVACALSRRFRDAARAAALTEALFSSPLLREVRMEQAVIVAALAMGPPLYLRAADSIYAAAAKEHDAALISWDNELIERAGALSPRSWLENNARL